MSSSNQSAITAKITPAVTSNAYPFASSAFAWNPSNIALGSGTAAGNIDQTYQAQVTATTGGASIQLNGGGLLDPVGNAVSPVRLDSLAAWNAGSNTVTLSGAAFASGYTAGASFSIKLDPGGWFVHAPGSASTSGIPIGTGTNSAITFTAASGTSAVQVYAAGRSV